MTRIHWFDRGTGIPKDRDEVNRLLRILFIIIIKSIKGELKTRPIYDCRCDERLEPKDDESTCLEYTGLIEELEYLKIETRLIDEKFASVMVECVI
jgi:hypothetical protein